MRRFTTARRASLGLATALALSSVAPASSWSQCPQPPFFLKPELGDAPEGQQAYPDLGIAGMFPTCIGGPTDCIFHAQILGGQLNNTFFGMKVDYEDDGNAGVCPPPPYERDECWGPADSDAGLVKPTSFTFGPTGPPFSAVTCSGTPIQSLGTPCGTARWGTDIDIGLTNNLFADEVPPTPQVVFLNVAIDFNRSGSWEPMIPTLCGPITEHVVQNLPVPIGFNGLASQLPIADFPIGSDSGYVWVRFTLSPYTVLTPWDGSGVFEGGETEDYMIHIAGNQIPAEYGDAPQGERAYPPFPVIGQFPTCTHTGAFVQHPPINTVFFGAGVDFEQDGNAGDCAFAVFDNDECFGGEAGLVMPRPNTIRRTPGLVITPCSPPATDLGKECQPIVWGTNLDIQITNNHAGDAYLNLLADWDQDGDWTSPPGNCSGGVTVLEHVIHNLVVPAGFNGLLSQLAPPNRSMGHRGYVWMRFTVSTSQVPRSWDGSGVLGEGETEDYLVHIGFDPDATDTQQSRPSRLQVGEATPSPTRAGTHVDLDLPAAASIVAAVYDASGRRVRDLRTVWAVRGAHRLQWDGRDISGKRPAAGVYFVRMQIGGETHIRRVLLLN